MSDAEVNELVRGWRRNYFVGERWYRKPPKELRVPAAAHAALAARVDPDVLGADVFRRDGRLVFRGIPIVCEESAA